MLVSPERIQATADRIAAEFHPDEIILFGSYAYGTPNDDSDVDLLVILPLTGTPLQKMGEIYHAVKDGFALDIVVADPPSVSRRFLEGDFFIREIVGQGKSLFRAKRGAMTPQTEEWVDKAEEDWDTLGRELRVRVKPSLGNVCFHAQQCAEKYLKAILQEDNIKFPKTHNLEELLALLAPTRPHFVSLDKHTQPIGMYAVLVRYPGFAPTRDEAKAAKKHAAAVRDTVRAALGLV